MILDVILFYGAALVALASGLFVISQRNPINSAFSLIITMCSLAVMFAMLGSGFIAVLQVVVYAGAIMVLFLFVVMLLNVPTEDPAQGYHPRLMGAGPRHFGVVLAAVLVAELVWAMSHLRLTPMPGDTGMTSSVYQIGLKLYREYAFAFEVTSVLILLAMVGAVVLARKES